MGKWIEKIGKSNIRNIISILVVVGCFLLLYIMQNKPIPSENKDIVLTAIGFVFGGALSGVIGYYYGSTKDNENKKSES